MSNPLSMIPATLVFLTGMLASAATTPWTPGGASVRDAAGNFYFVGPVWRSRKSKRDRLRSGTSQ